MMYFKSIALVAAMIFTITTIAWSKPGLWLRQQAAIERQIKLDPHLGGASKEIIKGTPKQIMRDFNSASQEEITMDQGRFIYCGNDVTNEKLVRLLEEGFYFIKTEFPELYSAFMEIKRAVISWDNKEPFPVVRHFTYTRELRFEIDRQFFETLVNLTDDYYKEASLILILFLGHAVQHKDEFFLLPERDPDYGTYNDVRDIFCPISESDRTLFLKGKQKWIAVDKLQKILEILNDSGDFLFLKYFEMLELDIENLKHIESTPFPNNPYLHMLMEYYEAYNFGRLEEYGNLNHVRCDFDKNSDRDMTALMYPEGSRVWEQKKMGEKWNIVIGRFKEELLSEDRLSYLKAICNIVNPAGVKQVGFYAGAGADVTTFLLATNVSRAYFVSRERLLAKDLQYGPTAILLSSDGLDEYIEVIKKTGGTSSTRILSEDKKLSGFAVFWATLQGRERRVYKGKIADPFVLECCALGIEKVSISLLQENVYNVYKVWFKWQHPDDTEPMEREIIYISADLNDSLNWEPFVKGGIDIYMEKALDINSSKEAGFRVKVKDKIKKDGIILCDEWNLDIVHGKRGNFSFVNEIITGMDYERVFKPESITTWEKKEGIFGYGEALIFRKISSQETGRMQHKKGMYEYLYSDI